MIGLFASHRTAANILMLAFMVLGAVALPNLQRDTFPVVPPKTVEVKIAYPGAAPADVEYGICQRVEGPIRAVESLGELTCDARENQALITAEIAPGGDIETFYTDIKSAVEGINSFPADVDKPVTRIVTRVATIGSVAVTGAKDPMALFAYASGVAERIGRDPRISQATLSGFAGREIAIAISARDLSRYGLTMSDVSAALARSSLDTPAGTLQTADGDTLISFRGEKRDPADLARIPLVSSPLGAKVNLGDVAKITTRFVDDASAAYFNGQRAAIITVTKTANQDALSVMDALLGHLEAERARAPEGVHLALSTDSTSNIRDRLRILSDNGLQGLALVLLAMWLFFGLRVSFWVALGLPVSFLGAIFVMQLMGLTINMITMVALVVAIGLLMDDAIVISENIVRRRRHGDDPMTAVTQGTKEVAPGVIASFLTTAIIVGPLSFLGGDTGDVLKYLPIVLLITLTVSLFEAFLVLPNHLRHALKNPRQPFVSRIVDKGFVWLRDRVIVPLVRLSLKARYFTLGLAVFAILLSLGPILGGQLKFRNFPTLESDTIQARVLLPDGSPLSRTKARVDKIVTGLEKLNAELTPDQPGGQALVNNVTVTYGLNADAGGTGPNMATVSADLLRAETRNSEIPEILDRWKKLTGPMPDMAGLRFTDKDRGVGGAPISVRLEGDDLDALKAASLEMRAFFLKFAGVRSVIDNLRPGQPEYVVSLRPAQAAALGITAQNVASVLRASFRGDTGLEVQDKYGSLDLTVTLDDAGAGGTGEISGLRIAASDGTLVPLSAVASISTARGYSAIERINGVRTVTVEGTINPKIANARELMAAMKKDFLPKLRQQHPGVTVVVGGAAKDTATTGASLQRNLLIGLAGVFLILAFQFRSFIQPLAVFASIPLALIGVVWGHMALGLQLSLPSLIGLATLAGIVVNNAILLVEFVKRHYTEGADLLDASTEAVRDRFRAIFLTSLTTIAGLTPLLFETSTQAQFLRPIVASLAFGLTAATFLALFVTPAVLMVLSDLRLFQADPDNPAGEGIKPAAKGAA